MAESVQLATIYLVDLVGSTRLATALGPVRADELRDEYFGLLREAIEASGGTEFKNTGDGLFAAFSSASAAVRCAVLTQQLFERRYRNQEQRLQVRIGLGTGESTVKDGDHFGMPSIEAARLCDKAPPDGILVSPATRMLAGRAEGARFESVGELELKGIPEPMEAFSLLWEPLDVERSTVDVGRWPLLQALRVVPRIAYVGRETERGLIEQARSHARSGARQVMLLSGEPGIGKTRLASYAALGANADGFGVCWGACSEDLAVPYEPWIAVCSQLVDHAPEEVLSEYAAMNGGEVRRLAGNLVRRLPDAPTPQSSDPETERFLLFKSVAELLRAVARAVPLCIVLDDFHWADGQSVALLKHVARNVEQGALQLLATYRDSDLTKEHPLTGALADMRRLEGVERIALRGLERDDVQAMTEAAAGHELDADGIALAAEIATETDGNPFFVGEILRNLSESGVVAYDEGSGRWLIDRSSGVALPESVRDVVERRVEVLGPGARQTLAAAAVIGRSFDLDLLSKLVEGDLLALLEAAVDAALLVESTDRVGRFAFAHALINHTLYEGLGATRRARMHLQIAESLEEMHGTESAEQLGELALHWRLATGSVDNAKAAGYALRAGRQALEQLAPSEAVRLFGDALELLASGDTTERCEALIGLGEAQQLTGEPVYRATLLEASRIALGMSDARLAVDAALANTRGFMSLIGDLDDKRVEAIEQTVRLADRSEPRRARLLALQSQELLYERDRARRQALATEAIALVPTIGDPRERARVLQHAFHGLWSPDMVSVRADLTDDLLAAAREAEDRALEFWALYLISHLSIETGDFTRAQEVLNRQQELAAALARPTLTWVTSIATAGRALLRGDLGAASQLAKLALAAGNAAGQPDALQIYGEQRAMIRAYQGRGGEELIELSRLGVATYPRMAVWSGSLAAYEAYFGDPEAASALLCEAVESRLEHVGWDTLRLVTLAFYADAVSRVPAADAAALIQELLEPWRDQFIWGGACPYGHVRLWLGVVAATLGRDGESDEHFAFACRYHGDHGLRLWEARSQLGWAQALSSRRDYASAREHGARALELARANGYGLIEALAQPIAIAEAPAGN